MNPLPPKISETAKHKRRWLWAALIALVVIPITVATVAALIFVGRFIHAMRQTVRNADAGFQKAKQTINPEELRAWALETIKRHPETNDGSPIIPESEIPKYIRDLFPQTPYTWVGKDQDSNQSVEFSWGGGFFGWWIEVGPTNLARSTNSGYPRAFMWVPGIYYSRESSLDLQ
jgi:hypothetical protein